MARLSRIEKAMRGAESYEEWLEAAHEHDEVTSNARWKRMDQSRRYDYVSIRVRLDQLRALRARHDDIGLLYLLNEGIHGNLGGMGRPTLYARAKVGTKQLITDFVEEIVLALEHIADPKVDSISFEDKLDFFRRASHCFGRSALMLSGAGSLLYFHTGVVKTLWEQGLLPDIISGSSGGAFVASMVGTHSRNELKRIFEPEYLLEEIERESNFWDSLTLFNLRQLQADDIAAAIERLVPDLTFQEAYERTGRKINISVAPAEPQQTSRLLNAIASPTVFVREALMASCAVPGIFPPVTLAARHVDGSKQPYLPTRRWVDGSITDDLPAKRLARLYGVNHFLVSQTNPLVLPFISDAKMKQTPAAIMSQAAQQTFKEWVKAGVSISNRSLSRQPRIYNLVRMTTSVIGQDYTADVNIFPSWRVVNPLRILAHRSPNEIMALIRAGERATWPKVEMIRITTRISRTLDRILESMEETAVQRLRAEHDAQRKAS